MSCWEKIYYGATFAVKEAIKELGFRYSPDKNSWYWRSDEDRSSNEKPIPLDMIREKFGSQQVALWYQQKMDIYMYPFFLLTLPAMDTGAIENNLL